MITTIIKIIITMEGLFLYCITNSNIKTKRWYFQNFGSTYTKEDTQLERNPCPTPVFN
jgi:hypothetical protein